MWKNYRTCRAVEAGKVGMAVRLFELARIVFNAGRVQMVWGSAVS